MPLIVATRNAKKVKELREILGQGIEDLSAWPEVPEPDETGRTFTQNACLKAIAYAQATGQSCLADDSGLEIDALAGGPGVHSARWAVRHNRIPADADRMAIDAANNALVLEQLDAVPDGRRTARFRCVIAVADPQGRVCFTASGAVEGLMLRAPRGREGFGYDPLFFHPPSGCTTAELSPQAKHAISHRGMAVRRAAELLRQYGWM